MTNFDVIEAYTEDFTKWSYRNYRGTAKITNNTIVITNVVETNNIVEDDNDMVELPDAYYTVVVHGDYDWEIRMSLYPLEGYTKFSKKYCSAYEAYRDGSTLYSIRNQVPTVNTNRTTY